MHSHSARFEGFPRPTIQRRLRQSGTRQSVALVVVKMQPCQSVRRIAAPGTTFDVTSANCRWATPRTEAKIATHHLVAGDIRPHCSVPLRTCCSSHARVLPEAAVIKPSTHTGVSSLFAHVGRAKTPRPELLEMDEYPSCGSHCGGHRCLLVRRRPQSRADEGAVDRRSRQLPHVAWRGYPKSRHHRPPITNALYSRPGSR